MWNFSLGGFFILFAVLLAAAYNGAVALRTRAWSAFGAEFQGRAAIAAGIVLLAIAAGAAAWLLYLLAAANAP